MNQLEKGETTFRGRGGGKERETHVDTCSRHVCHESAKRSHPPPNPPSPTSKLHGSVHLPSWKESMIVGHSWSTREIT